MKHLFKSFNWKNFLQRTFLFFIVFAVIRLMVDWVEGDISISRLARQSLFRYLIFAMVLGFLDSETWAAYKNANQNQDEPVVFANMRSAIMHYAGVAFFISLLCGLILILFSLVRWAITILYEKKNTAIFPDFGMYLLVIAVIGICFASYDALRNYQRLRKKNRPS